MSKLWLSWPHTTSPCPAKGQQCYKCGKPNRFAKVFISKPSFPTKPEALQKPFTSKRDTANQRIKAADSNSSSDDEYMHTLSLSSTVSKVPTVSVNINNIPIDMIVDTGTSIDVLDESAFENVCYHDNILLTPSPKQFVCLWLNNPAEAAFNLLFHTMHLYISWSRRYPWFPARSCSHS